MQSFENEEYLFTEFNYNAEIIGKQFEKIKLIANFSVSKNIYHQTIIDLCPHSRYKITITCVESYRSTKIR